MKQWVDVPGGWAYGWPKLYDPEKDGDLLEWIHRMGYKGSLEDVSGWMFSFSGWLSARVTPAQSPSTPRES